MKREEKESLVADMAARLQKAKAAYLVDYQGLTVEIMNALRKQLRKNDVEFQVVKNRLLKLASKDTDTAIMKEHFVGPCALATSHDDVVAAAKVLVEHEKKYEHLKLKAGQIGGTRLVWRIFEEWRVFPAGKCFSDRRSRPCKPYPVRW